MRISSFRHGIQLLQKKHPHRHGKYFLILTPKTFDGILIFLITST